MRVLVTGGAGFFGSHLVDALIARGDQVVVFDHKLREKALSEKLLRNIDAVEGDIRDADAVTAVARDCDEIFHCAALVGVNIYNDQPAQTMETEEVGLRNVCAAAVLSQAKVIYASSSAVYGRLGGKLSESQAAPDSNYGTAKRFGELYLAARYRESGLKSVTLRIFNMYGPRQDERLVIPRFIKNAFSGLPIKIFGDGNQTRDFVYVGDVARAALTLSHYINGCEIINVCSGCGTSVRELAETVCRLTGTSSDIVTECLPPERLPFEVANSLGDLKKLESLVGVVKPTSLEDGLIKTIASMAKS